MKQIQFSEEELFKTKAIAEAIASLETNPNFQHFVRAAEALIASSSPEASQFTSDEATVIASRVAFCSGIKRCLGLIKQQKEILYSVEQRLNSKKVSNPDSDDAGR